MKSPKVAVNAKIPTMKLAKRLEFKKPIAEGAMGAVRKAFDHNLLRDTAVKILKQPEKKHLLRLRRFIEEAQITAQLDHPHIIPIHELGVDSSGAYYFTMKLVRGQDFNQILWQRDTTKPTPKELFYLLQIFTKVCDAVAFAHSKGVIHRDIKPENIMVGDYGEVYLTDWGIARLMQGRHVSDLDLKVDKRANNPMLKTGKGQIVGTPQYMAPEQAWGKLDELDERTDIFALGGVLYRILTGSPPFEGNSPESCSIMAAMCHIKPPQERVDHELPRGLCCIAQKALQEKKSDRYQSVQDLKNAVENFLQAGWRFPNKEFAAATVIVEQGQPGNHAYIINSGSCRVYKTDHGRQTDLITLGPGDVFGETALFSAQPRTASVAAVDRVSTTVISEEDFQEVINSGFWFGLFTKNLANRFRDLDQELMETKQKLQQSELLLETLKLFHSSAESHSPSGQHELGLSHLFDVLYPQFPHSRKEVLRALTDSGLFHVDRDRQVLIAARQQ